MLEQKNTEKAKRIFSLFCNRLNEYNLDYKRNDSNMTLDFFAKGDYHNIEINFHVNAARMIVVLLSQMPFIVKQNKRLDFAIAVSVANNSLVDGSFDYDISSGNVFFRMTNSFSDNIISTDVFDYMVFTALETISDFKDKLYMVSKGEISLKKFISMI